MRVCHVGGSEPISSVAAFRHRGPETPPPDVNSCSERHDPD
jgi:hypothetical protein